MAAITFQISISKKDAIQMVLKDWAKVYNNRGRNLNCVSF